MKLVLALVLGLAAGFAVAKTTVRAPEKYDPIDPGMALRMMKRGPCKESGTLNVLRWTYCATRGKDGLWHSQECQDGCHEVTFLFVESMLVTVEE